MKVEISELADAVGAALDEAVEEKAEKYKRLIRNKTRQMTDVIKVSSPRTTRNAENGHYADGWRSSFEEDWAGLTGITKNPKHYKLTHIINDGTIDRYTDSTGAFRGFVTRNPHVDRASAPVLQEFIEEIKNI